MFLRASILAYTQQYHWSLVRLAVFVSVTVNSRAPCLLTALRHVPISVTVNSDNTRSTTDHSSCLNGVNSCCVSPPPTTTLCVFYGEPCLYNLVRCSSVYTSTCRFAERAVLRFVTGHFIAYIKYTEPVAHTSPVGSLPLAQNA